MWRTTILLEDIEMGFLAKLFGGGATPPANLQSNTRGALLDDPDRTGGPNHPWICEQPKNLKELRNIFMDSLPGNKDIVGMMPESEQVLDSMIAEMLKMAFLEDTFGKEGRTWECGDRKYLEGSIQTQAVIFKNGRPPLVFYSDFSKFGAFADVPAPVKTQDKNATKALSEEEKKLVQQEKISKIRASAESGDRDAQFSLGCFCDDYRNVAKNESEAAAWYCKAAEQGHPIAQDNLGLMYAGGRGVTRDDAQAVFWFQKSAEQGDGSAQNNLGVCYLRGSGVPQNHETARVCFQNSCGNGHIDAFHNLAVMYRDAKGGDENLEKAFDLFFKAADMGHAPSQSSVGFMYGTGLGVSKDLFQAVAWYRKAAVQGNAAGLFNLGVMYESGSGVNQNIAAAHILYCIASNQGSKNATEARDRLIPQLSIDDLSKAEAATNNWKPGMDVDPSIKCCNIIDWKMPKDGEMGMIATTCNRTAVPGGNGLCKECAEEMSHKVHINPRRLP